MRFTTVVVLGAAVASTSASLIVRQLPVCYDTCVLQSDSGGCSSTDVVCLCMNKNFVSETVACLEVTCTGAALAQAIAYGESVCAAYGVTTSPSSPSPSLPPSHSPTPTPTPTPTSTSTPTPTGLGSTGIIKSAAAAHGVNTLISLVAVGLVTLAL